MTKPDQFTKIAAEQKGYAAGYSAMMEVATPPPTDTAILPAKSPTASDVDLHRLILEKSLTLEEAENTLEFIRKNPEFINCKTPQERRKFLNKKINEVQHRHRDIAAQISKLDYLRRRVDALQEMFEWAQKPLLLQKPDNTMFRALRRDVKDGAALYFSKETEDVLPAADYDREVFCNAEILVVEHNWADAFKNTSILKDDQVRLPYDVCAFEFKISGRQVIALATQLESEIYFSPVVSTSKGWVVHAFAINATDTFQAAYQELDQGYVDLFYVLGQQIKAICIAIDAEVATSEMVREPHVGQSGKNTFAALSSYRVVSLARRYARALPSDVGGVGRRKRLHFRRGHWRHFPTFKTWIKWCLVGDPELGFIDKHYKL